MSEFSVYVSDTSINRKEAEAPNTYQALLALLGKVYTGCFHHLPPLRFHSEPWLLQLKFIMFSFQTDTYQCKIITHGSYPRVKLKRPQGRNKKGFRCKEGAMDSSHPSCTSLVTWLCPPKQGSLSLPLFQSLSVNPGPRSTLWGCPMWSSRKALLNHAGKQEAHGSFLSF